MLELDVLVISDFRLPGGTNHSTAQELAVHREAGIRTGLIHCHSRLSSRPLPWSDPILQNLSPGRIEPVPIGTPTHAQLAILRHPIALEAMPDLRGTVSVDHALIIANQTAVRPDGKIEYDAAEINDIVTDRLGVRPVWAPIGPVVRNSLEPWSGQITMRALDWTNIFAAGELPVPRADFNRERPRIGRHSRPQPAKWPDSADDIRNAYPVTNDFDVRILGGAKPAISLLGESPAAWTVHKFGAMEPQEFLKDVDFWVYFHHPQWLEAYGRAIMEALWSGAVVILPEYFRVTYGDAAVYGTPSEVREIIESFRTGDRDFLAQSATGQSYAAQHASSLHLERLREFVELPVKEVGPAEAVKKEHRALVPPKPQLQTAWSGLRSRFANDTRPRALFVTSNGAGMGHLTRMLGIARAAAGDIDPIFFSMSQGLSVVGQAGLPFEYVPFNSALQTKSALWHHYFDARLSAAIDHYEAEIVVFDGTWPYRGMLQTFDRHELLKVWVRRGMWKPAITPEQLEVGKRFDVVIEPGDFASEYDQGATRQVTDAELIAPITVLDHHEILSRAEALDELGLSDKSDQRFALVTLGAGNINDVSTLQSQFVDAIERLPGWQPIVTKVPISADHSASSAWSISAFPLARYTRMFDFSVSAAGYNSFSEWMSGSLPTVWIPNLETQTDDQDARARWAADTGRGVRVVGDKVEDIQSAVRLMSDPQQLEAMRARLAALPKADGAAAAASIISDAWNRFSAMSDRRNHA